MTITTPDTDTTRRRVWVGCLACYNDGRLVGIWIDADQAADLTGRELHRRAGSEWDVRDRNTGYGPHEELWCLDVEGFPGSLNHEMDPSTATLYDQVLQEAQEAGYPADAVAGFYDAISEPFPTEWDLPTENRFSDAYQGTWSSVRAYAEEILLDETLDATLEPLDEETRAWVRSHFDVDSYAREIDQDLTTVDTSDGVYIFTI